MEKNAENSTETDRDDASEATGPTAQQPERPRGQVDVNDSKVVACYANFCRVTGTPEELIVDFGLNKNMQPAAHEPVDIAQRIIFNFFTAKRLAAALVMAVQRHEAAFGVLETDVQKRVVSTGRSG